MAAVDAHLEALRRFRMMRRRLSGTSTVGALFAAAAQVAREELGFTPLTSIEETARSVDADRW